MTFIVLVSAPAALRGAVTRWLFEISPGIYVGKISKRVREHLWNKISRELRGGTAMIISPVKNEQGFDIRTLGPTRWQPVDHDGLTLIRRPRT